METRKQNIMMKKCGTCSNMGDFTDEEYETFKKVLTRTVLYHSRTFTNVKGQSVTKTAIRPTLEYLKTGFYYKNLNSELKGASHYPSEDVLLQMLDEGRGHEEKSLCKVCGRTKVYKEINKSDDLLVQINNNNNNNNNNDDPPIPYDDRLITFEKPKIRPVLLDGFSSVIENKEEEEEEVEVVEEEDEDDNNMDNTNQLIENNDNIQINQAVVVKMIPKKEIMRNKRVDSLLIKYRAKDAHRTFDSLYRLYRTNPINFFNLKKRDFKEKVRQRIFRIISKEYKNVQLQ